MTLPKRKNCFADLGLDDWLVDQCTAVGLTQPTEIQTKCIPAILEGRDVIGCAKTGSGKTAAFALPILQRLGEDPYGIYAIVLSPTRELAYQIGDQFKAFGKPLHIRVTIITGGMDYVAQGKDLEDKPHILVSTPGRLSDLVTSSDMFKIDKVKFIVLDEADRLLTAFGDFAEQMQPVFEMLPSRRQTLLFSATMSDTFKLLQQSAMAKPFFVDTVTEQATVDTLDQRYLLCPFELKDAYVVELLRTHLEKHKESLIIIFAQTCKYAQILGMILKRLGFSNCVLHSMIPQPERNSALSIFKSHKVKILVATDLASRGLDIPTVDLIINHNVPTKASDYIHRVGRTARAGRTGGAVTLVTQFDVNLIKAVEALINMQLVESTIDQTSLKKILLQVAVARREAEITLDERNFGAHKERSKRMRLILAGKDPDEVGRKQAEVAEVRNREAFEQNQREVDGIVAQHNRKGRKRNKNDDPLHEQPVQKTSTKPKKKSGKKKADKSS